MIREITYCEALNEALHQEMQRDSSVIVMGEEVAGGGERPGMIDCWGGVFGVTKGLIGKFGAARVWLMIRTAEKVNFRRGLWLRCVQETIISDHICGFAIILA